MSDEKAIYWLTQVSGWFGYILLILFQNLMIDRVDLGIVKVLFVNFILGVGLSHLMRGVIVSAGMLSMKILKVIPRIILLSIATGILSALIYAVVSDVFFNGISNILSPPYGLFIELLFPFTTIYVIWNILYFAAIYLKNYEREEVKNLRLTSSMNEIELGNLRAQLNPHFMFNALNSIRALIDEDPKMAKLSVTRISRILRSSLVAGRRKLVPLKEEIELVKDYLSLEKIRYEERLDYAINVPRDLQDALVPPILLQTLVENSIKHGISRLQKGGIISITATHQGPGEICITVTNTGELKPQDESKEHSTSVGLENSRRRLNLLFGDAATLDIYSDRGEVICRLSLPFFTNNQDRNENNYR
jgi:sensor histidine kinase YesM